MTTGKLATCFLTMILLALTVAPTTLAKDVNSSAGTSAFPFLKINIGARQVAMGGASTGLADDVAALYYNPAGIAGLEDNMFVAGYHNYFADIQSGFLGLVRPINAKSSYGVYASYLSYGTFIETDLAGNITGEFGGSDMVIGFTYGMQRTHRFSLGVSAKFVYEKIQQFSATALAIDIGGKYTSDRGRFAGGIVLQNLGAQLSSLGEGDKDGLPTVVRIGASARPRTVPVQFVSDIIVPFDNDIVFAIGAEYYELESIRIRAGWNSFGSNFRADDSEDSWAGFNVGFGIEFHSMQFSYALSPGADLGNSHRITLTGKY